MLALENHGAERTWQDAEWTEICSLEDITPNTGVAALVAGRQVAIVRVGSIDLYAIGNFDPFSKAFVLARGIVGDRNGTPKIASPIYKQNFDLRSGACLDDPSVNVPSYGVRVRDGRVEVNASDVQRGGRSVEGAKS